MSYATTEVVALAAGASRLIRALMRQMEVIAGQAGETHDAFVHLNTRGRQEQAPLYKDLCPQGGRYLSFKVDCKQKNE